MLTGIPASCIRSATAMWLMIAVKANKPLSGLMQCGKVGGMSSAFCRGRCPVCPVLQSRRRA